MENMGSEEASDLALSELTDQCMTLELCAARIREREAELKDLKQVRKGLEQDLAKVFVALGMQKFQFENSTFSVRRDFFVNKAGGVPMEDACAALRDAEMEEYVSENYSPSQVRAHIKELVAELPPGVDAVEALPDSLKGVFKIYEVPSVKVRSN